MSEDAPHWFKSSHSDFNANCLEADFGRTSTARVRDTQNRTGVLLEVDASEWVALIGPLLAAPRALDSRH